MGDGTGTDEEPEPVQQMVPAAAQALGTTRRRIWAMVKAGQLEAFQKLISRAQIQKLAPFAKALRRNLATPRP